MPNEVLDFIVKVIDYERRFRSLPLWRSMQGHVALRRGFSFEKEPLDYVLKTTIITALP